MAVVGPPGRVARADRPLHAHPRQRRHGVRDDRPDARRRARLAGLRRQHRALPATGDRPRWARRAPLAGAAGRLPALVRRRVDPVPRLARARRVGGGRAVEHLGRHARRGRRRGGAAAPLAIATRGTVAGRGWRCGGCGGVRGYRLALGPRQPRRRPPGPDDGGKLGGSPPCGAAGHHGRGEWSAHRLGEAQGRRLAALGGERRSSA